MTVAEAESLPTREQELEVLVRRMQGELTATSDKLAATSNELAAVTSERDILWRACRQLTEQFELLQRRISMTAMAKSRTRPLTRSPTLQARAHPVITAQTRKLCRRVAETSPTVM